MQQPAMDQLALNLSIIFISRLISGNLLEIYMPKYKAQLRLKQESGSNDESILTVPEQEYILAPYDIIKGVIKDYAELAVQFGYLTLFVVAFPAAPFLAFISNVVEIKVDGFKILHYQQRPVPAAAEDIGTWQVIFTLIAGAAVISNGALTCFTMETLDGHSNYTRAWFFLGFQYLVFSVMYLVSLIIPDEPEDVAIQLQRRESIVPKIIDRVADEDETDLLEQLGSMRDSMHIHITIDDKL
jgi:anoctamin-10/anoctamin-7